MVKTVVELRAELSKQLEDENKKAVANDVQVAVLDKLVSENPFQVPDLS